MKKLISMLTLVALLILSGCGGHKYASYEPSSANKDGVARYHGNSVGLFSKTPTPTETATAERINAEAYAIRKDADTESQRQQQLAKKRQEEARSDPDLNANNKGIIVFGVINNDPHRTLYFTHPQIPGFKITMKPRGGLGVAELTSLPASLDMYDASNNQFVGQTKLTKTINTTGKTINGVKFNKLIEINNANPTIARRK